MNIQIQKYSISDQNDWLNCHTQSYYQSVFFDELLKIKPRYETPAIELIGLDEGVIVGILDIEIEEERGQLCTSDKEISGLISVIGVLPQYRRKKIATKMLNRAIEILEKEYSIHRLELWTREDNRIISWLQCHKFEEIFRFYQITFASDFFSKYEIELPFSISPEILIASIDEDTYSTLNMYHPPEKAERILIFEKNIQSM